MTFRNVFSGVIFACGFTSGEGWDGNSGGLRQSGSRKRGSVPEMSESLA